MDIDNYSQIADSYDRMHKENPERVDFFRRLFGLYNVRTVLDCACGTGNDLLMFTGLGFDVFGSDLSESMLYQAKKKIRNAGFAIPCIKADFRELNKHFDRKFDAIVCLNNSINEVHDDSHVVQAVSGMRELLNEGGILVIDQGQTDLSMKNPPGYAPVINARDFTRVFVMKYSDELMNVDILDFIHSENEASFKTSTHKIKIRLYDDWSTIMEQAELPMVDFFGNWQFEEYNKDKSNRLILVAEK